MHDIARTHFPIASVKIRALPAQPVPALAVPALAVFALAVLVLGCGPAHAYRIVEGRYRVEVAPGVQQDQLVVRCNDDRLLTVAWDTNLGEACDEHPAREPASTAGQSAAAAASGARETTPASIDFTSGVVESGDFKPGDFKSGDFKPGDFASGVEVQKRVQLTRLRVQAGDVPEHLLWFQNGPDGVTLHHAPALAEVLKRFEACRAARRSDCVAVRNAAYARLRQNAPPQVAGVAAGAERAGPGTRTRPAARTRSSAEPRIVRSAP